MKPSRNLFAIALLAVAVGMPAYAQTASSAASTQIIVPAFGEVVQANDQAQATLMVEEQDKDKAVAASRVNQKMNQGIALLRKQDPQAKLRTRGYYTYAVYPDDQPRGVGPVAVKPRQPTAWRVGQYLELTTTNLTALPQTVAAAQGVMALNGLRFGLSPAAVKQSDAALIDATYKNLTERIAAIARAMGRNPAELTLDTLDFEGSGNYAGNEAAPKSMMAMRAAAPAQEVVAEPSFEPGETTLNMRAVGKVKFK
jgi:predicted secreted protein